MSEEADRDEKTEEPTQKRKDEAVEKGDVLQSRELGQAYGDRVTMAAELR